jgi:phospholipase A1
VTYSKTNIEPYVDLLQGAEFDHIEAKFQVSLKYVAVEDFFFRDLDLQFAFTATSWWQSYNSDISAPFRETNYEPELIFNYHNPWSILGIDVGNSFLSLNHQSNGQSGTLSRSWNRLIAGIAFTVDNVAWGITTWYRFPEEAKIDLASPRGDDNPDIEKYMGYGEIGALWQITEGHNLDIMLRNNFRSDNKGAIQLGWSFPFSKHLRGYIEYFNGYGESLIYYDQSVERIGIGVKLTDWL